MNKSNPHPTLALPGKNDRLLLHTCCAPCSGGIIRSLIDNKISPVIYFYNPNIFPFEEYLHRKEEIKKYALKCQLKFVDADYTPEQWQTYIKGFENEPERGRRCSKCFDLRLENTAEYASKNNFSIFTTTLGISRWKDIKQVFESGRAAAARFSNVLFWDYNWRKQGGSYLMYTIAKQEQFYRQNYCGCRYSMRANPTRSSANSQ